MVLIGIEPVNLNVKGSNELVVLAKVFITPKDVVLSMLKAYQQRSNCNIQSRRRA